MAFSGRPPDTRGQRLRHDRQTGSPGDPERADAVAQHARRRPQNIPLPDERLEERQEADEIWRSKGNVKRTFTYLDYIHHITD